MNRPVLFVDTETTSLSPFAGIWEFAAIRRSPAGHRDEVQFFIGEVDLTHADAQALEVGGFYDRYPQAHRWTPATSPAGVSPKPGPMGGKVFSPQLAAQTIARVCQGAEIVGSNPGFDTERMARLLRKNKIAPTWHYRPVDVHTLMVGYLTAIAPTVDINRYRSQSTDALADLMRVQPALAERHTAMGDALWCERIWNRIYEGGEDVA